MRTWIVTCLLAALDAAAAAGIAASKPDAARVERGKYLVGIMACNDCHTPWKMGPHGPEPDMTRLLSGHPAGTEFPPPPDTMGPWMLAGSATNTAWATPLGIAYTANLTPDQATGLGIWTEDLFVKVIRTGKSRGAGRMLLPPMPWQAYANATDDDLKAIFAYLQSIPAISNEVPPAKVNPAPGAR